MRTSSILLSIGGALLLGMAAWFVVASNIHLGSGGKVTGTATTSGDQIYCATDMQECADHSYVSRAAPSCAFAACPPTTTSVDVGLGQEAHAFAVSITPLSIVEDSRCPVDVQCIQAGTVRLKIQVVNGMGSSAPTITLGQTITTDAEEITLVSVAPARHSGANITDAQYRFTFRIDKRIFDYKQ